MKALIALLAGLVGLALPIEAIDTIARLALPVIALTSTSIFPCMTLAVGAMKGDHREPEQVDELHRKLRSLMQMLSMAFTTAVLAMAFLVATAAAHSSFEIAKWMPAVFHLMWLLAVFSLALLLMRARSIVRMFGEILDLSRTQAMLMARAKLKVEQQDARTRVKFEKQEDRDPRLLQRAS